MLYKVILFPVMFFLAVCSLSAEQIISLKDAHDQHLVSSMMYGILGGSHEGQSIHANIENNSNRSLTINIAAGQILLPNDTTVQNLMVTEDMVVKLEPGKTARIMLYAYCVKIKGYGPGIKDTFNIGPMAKGALLSIARHFNETKYHGGAAQDAVWCASDGERLESIVAENETLTNQIRQLVATATQRPFVAYKEGLATQPENLVIRTTRTEVPAFKLFTGGVSMQVPSGTNIRIVLTDDAGKELRELYSVNSGNSTKQLDFPFELDGRTMENKMYFVSYYIAGNKFRDIPVNNKSVNGYRF